MTGAAPWAPIAITAGAFAFSSSTTRCAIFGPMPLSPLRIAVTSPSHSARNPLGPERAEDCQRRLGAHALHGHQQPVPLPLRQGAKTVELHQVLPDQQVGIERHRLPGRRHRRQRPVRQQCTT